MTEDFRRLALELPGVEERSHMRHPDFRVNGKIFATLHYPDEEWGMVKLPPEEQDKFVESRPDVFVPVKGASGRQGSTNVRLEKGETTIVEHALRLAWSYAETTSKKDGTARKRSRPRPAKRAN